MPFATPLGPLLNVVDAEDDDYWRWVLGGGGDDDEDWDGGDDFDYFLPVVISSCVAFVLVFVVADIFALDVAVVAVAAVHWSGTTIHGGSNFRAVCGDDDPPRHLNNWYDC
jgi:hypothetical protein